MTAPAMPELGQELGRLLGGLSLAAVYGLSLGARRGGVGLPRHALGAPATLLGVAAIAIPSLFVVLPLFDAPVTLAKAVSATARAAASAACFWRGLAPATALLVVTIDSASAAAFVARAGLPLAAAFAGLPLLAAFHAELRSASAGTRWKCRPRAARLCRVQSRAGDAHGLGPLADPGRCVMTPTAFSLLEQLLRSPVTVAEYCRSERDPKPLFLAALLATVSGALVFGAALATSRRGVQLPYSAAKLPLALLGTLILLVPALHAILAGLGRPLRMSTVATLVLAASGRAALVLLSLSPVVW